MYNYCGSKKEILLVALCLLLLESNIKTVSGYTKVAYSGRQDNDEGPKIFRALNMDLIYPKTFNATPGMVVQSTPPTSILPKDNPSFSYEITTKPTLFVTPASISDHSDPQVWPPQSPPENKSQSKSTQNQYHDSSKDDETNYQQEQIEQQQQQASTGRAIDYAPSYQLGQFMQPLIKSVSRPAQASRPSPNQYTRPTSSTLSKIVYPQSYQAARKPINNKWRNPAQIQHRYSPGEAVASGHFFKHNHAPKPSSSRGTGSSGKVPAATSIIQTYVPPKNLYAFPPNINVNYPSPSKDPKAALPTGIISSYAAPASGPLPDYPLAAASSSDIGYKYPAASSSDNGYKYPGPVNQEYLPPSSDEGIKDSNGDGGSAGNGDDDMVGVLPASAMDSNGGGDMKDMAGMDMPPDTHDHDHDHHHDQDHDHDHSLSGYDTGIEYPTPPPGWIEDHPEATQDPPKDAPSDDSAAPADMSAGPPDMSPSDMDHDDHHDHDHDHDHHFDFPSLYSSYDHHHYPDIIYDDHHHDHHHPPPPTLPPPISTLPPPAEPPPEPRVKKYSYFYIGRKLWYIPLYFTVWFSFYVLWLILKSIARHKVNLPNHYVNRRSLPENENSQEYMNRLTANVLTQIEDFKRKYLT